MANDMQIRHDVMVALDREPSVIAGTIGVEVHHGVVKLAGHVSDAGIKTDAERAAVGVDDVRAVVMDVGVAGLETVGAPAIV
jgi:osmotically-inducible protein OsmY